MRDYSPLQFQIKKGSSGSCHRIIVFQLASYILTFLLNFAGKIIVAWNYGSVTTAFLLSFFFFLAKFFAFTCLAPFRGQSEQK